MQHRRTKHQPEPVVHANDSAWVPQIDQLYGTPDQSVPGHPGWTPGITLNPSPLSAARASYFGVAPSAFMGRPSALSRVPGQAMSSALDQVAVLEQSASTSGPVNGYGLAQVATRDYERSLSLAEEALTNGFGFDGSLISHSTSHAISSMLSDASPSVMYLPAATPDAGLLSASLPNAEKSNSSARLSKPPKPAKHSLPPSTVNAASSASAKNKKRPRTEDDLEDEDVRRPPNCFMLFRSHLLSDAEKERTREMAREANQKNLVTFVSDLWNGMSVAEQAPWKKEAEVAFFKHKQLHPNWKWKARLTKLQTQKSMAKSPSATQKRDRKRAKKLNDSEPGPYVPTFREMITPETVKAEQQHQRELKAAGAGARMLASTSTGAGSDTSLSHNGVTSDLTPVSTRSTSDASQAYLGWQTGPVTPFTPGVVMDTSLMFTHDDDYDWGFGPPGQPNFDMRMANPSNAPNMQELPHALYNPHLNFAYVQQTHEDGRAGQTPRVPHADGQQSNVEIGLLHQHVQPSST